MKYFDNFSSHHKFVNTIWELKNEDNEVVTRFEDLAKVEVVHFGKIFKHDEKVSLVDVVKLSQRTMNQLQINIQIRLASNKTQ